MDAMTTKELRELINEPRYKYVIKAIEYVHGLADGKGTIVCPRCGGTLFYEKRAIKPDREWSKGKCETNDCISWIV